MAYDPHLESIKGRRRRSTLFTHFVLLDNRRDFPSRSAFQNSRSDRWLLGGPAGDSCTSHGPIAEIAAKHWGTALPSFCRLPSSLLAGPRRRFPAVLAKQADACAEAG